MITDEKRKEIKRLADRIFDDILWNERTDNYNDEEMMYLYMEIISQMSQGWLTI